MVFQSYALFPHMSVLENVCYGLRRSGSAGRPRRAARPRGPEAGRAAGFEERQPSELSGGQQQRVAVARALVLKPSVLLFDEPLSNLDARLRRQMREEIRELQQRLGLTVVYVTHDQQEAMAVSDRIIVMNAGRIEQQGGPRDLYERPATPFLARFIGESNPARGNVRRLAPARSVSGWARPRSRSPTRAPPTARPRWRCARRRSRRPAPGPAGALSGKIAKASYLGTHMEYSIDTAAGTLFATCPRVERPLAVGTAVAVTLAPRGVIIVGQ